MLVPDATLEYCAARMSDFFGRRTPWQRRLWGVGSSLILQEVLEASEFRHQGHFTDETLKDLCRAAARQIGRDPGVGAGELRGDLCRSLTDGGLPDRHLERRLEHLAERSRQGYFQRLAGHIRGSSTIDAEWLARALASHLLDMGFSADHLHRWLTQLVRGPSPITLVDLVNHAENVANTPPRVYTVVVPMARVPRLGMAMPEHWIEPSDLAIWLRSRPSYRPVRHVGAFEFRLDARDPWHAINQVTERLERLVARVAVGVPGAPAFEHVGLAWIAGHRDPFRLSSIHREVEIHALQRQSLVYSAGGFGYAIDAALQLASSLDRDSPGSAIAGGWAAVESLFSGPEDKAHIAAQRLSAVVACSYPRAELTTLAYVHAERSGDGLSQSLSQSQSNRERAFLVAAAISGSQTVSTRGPSDEAAVRRMSSLLADPKQVLSRVSQYVGEALRRLYRQRNLVMHAGTTDSIALSAALRSAPSLVGAGVDRVVHAFSKEGISPLRLAARAEAELELVGTPGGRGVVDLLE